MVLGSYRPGSVGMAGERVEGVGVVQLEQVANVQEGQKETKSLDRKNKSNMCSFRGMEEVYLPAIQGNYDIQTNEPTSRLTADRTTNNGQT